MDFELDEQGMIITKPLTGWVLAPVAGIAVLTRLEYVDSEKDISDGSRHSVQLILTPQQAIDLAATLERQVAAIMNQNAPRRPS